MPSVSNRAAAHLARHWPAWLAGLGALALFGYRFGFEMVDPAHDAWLLNRQDPATTYISWLFYRSEPWSFPLGQVHGYLAPIGTTVGLTDSLPLVAVPLKALRSLLPEPFQYFGAWVLANYVLQAVFGWLIAGRFTAHRGLRAAGAALFLFSPVFLVKENHMALSTHWLLLAALWLYLQPPATVTARGFALRWGLLLAVVCGVHPYLAMMVLALAGAALLRAWWWDRRLRWWQAALLAAGAPALMLVEWTLLGYQLGGNIAGGGAVVWGATALNLNGLINPLTTSRFLPELPVAIENRFEGFAYLGLGLLAALVLGAALALAARRGRPAAPEGGWRRWPHWPLVAVLAVLVLVALGDSPSLGERELLRYELPDPLRALLNPFRAAGRFAWPLVYVLAAGAIALAAAAHRRRADSRAWRTGIVGGLAACCVLQAVDVSGMLDMRDHYRNETWRTRARSPEWSAALADVDRLLTYPPFKMSTNFELDYKDLAMLAWRHGIETSAGYAARLSHEAADRNIDRFRAQMFAGRADPRAVYVLRNSYFAEKYPAMRDDFLATELDGFKVCVPRTGTWRPRRQYRVRPVELAPFLRQAAERTVVLAVSGSYTLQPEARDVLAELGAALAGYRPGEAFVIVIHRGRALVDVVLGDEVFQAGVPAGAAVGPLALRKELVIVAANARVGGRVLIEVGGLERSFGTRGLNAVVLDDGQDLLEAASFPLGYAGNTGHAFALVPRQPR